MTDPERQLVTMLRNTAPKYHLFERFRDFVAIAAYTYSNVVDHVNRERREAAYLEIAKRYTREELTQFARGIAYIVEALDSGLDDFLGRVYMSLDLGNEWAGQFFTPYSVSKLMALINIGRAPEIIAQEGFITVSDPCIGAGSMVIAMADALQTSGINYQQCMHAIGVDVDIIAVHMAYIQATILNIPAIIYHGNSLTLETWSEWRTFGHVAGFWDSKLARKKKETQLRPHESPETNPAVMPIVLTPVNETIVRLTHRATATSESGEQIGFEF